MASGMNYAPDAFVEKACEKGEFIIAAVGLEHGHIIGMCKNLENAGACSASCHSHD